MASHFKVAHHDGDNLDHEKDTDMVTAASAKYDHSPHKHQQSSQGCLLDAGSDTALIVSADIAKVLRAQHICGPLYILTTSELHMILSIPGRGRGIFSAVPLAAGTLVMLAAPYAR